MDAAVHFAVEEAGGFEDAEVFGNRGERNAERFGEFGDHGLALSEAGEDGAAGRISEGPESGVEMRAARIVNHMV